MSSIRFSCDDCGKGYKVPDKFAGKKVKCKECGNAMKVPMESASSDSSKTSKPASKSAKSPKASAKSPKAESKPQARPAKAAKGTPKAKGKTATGTVVLEAPEDISSKLKLYENKREDSSHARGEGRLVLFVDDKPSKSYRLDKGESMVVGRDEGCDIVIEDDSVSGEHCKVEYRLGKFIMTDKRSSNGLIVNEKAVRRASLNNGDIIQLGRAILRIDCG